jgi:hypothetical protein
MFVKRDVIAVKAQSRTDWAYPKYRQHAGLIGLQRQTKNELSESFRAIQKCLLTQYAGLPRRARNDRKRE